MYAWKKGRILRDGQEEVKYCAGNFITIVLHIGNMFDYVTQGCINFPSIYETQIHGAGMVTWSSFHSEDPNILGTTVQNLVTKVT
jgi:hypothetical protein